MTLRFSIPVTLAAVVLAPALLLLGFAALSSSGESRLRAQVAEVAQRLRLSGHADDPAFTNALAREEMMQITVYSLEGEPQLRADHARRQYNTLGIPSLSASAVDPAPTAPLDEHLRARVLSEGSVQTCVLGQQGAVFECSYLIRTEGTDGLLIEVRSDAVRGMTRLLDASSQALGRPLLVFTGFALLVGLFLSWRLTRGLIGPLRSLHRQVQERSAGVIDTTGVAVEGPAELVDVAEAFSRLLTNLDIERSRSERLVEDLTHQLKSPLASLGAAIDMLAPTPGNDLNLTEKQKQELGETAKAAVGRIDESIGRLLTISRAEAGRFEEEEQRFDIVALARSVGQTFSDENVGTVTFAFDGPSDPTFVTGAPNALGDALRALLENAFSFADSNVTLKLERENDQLILSVLDDGPGVEETQTDYVFERFYSRRSGGTGIGLSLVAAVAAGHGGRAWAQPGPGGKFHIAMSLVS